MSERLPADEYLTTDEVRQLKQILDEQAEQILKGSHETVGNLTEVQVQDADALDLAVTSSNREFMLRLADRERRLLRKINKALERIQEGEYGTCESCGEAITFGRLMARPVATLCIDCKTEAEQLETRRRLF